MERPYEYLRRVAGIVPERDKEKLADLANQLEKLGRVYSIKVEDKQGLLNKVLQENGIFLTDGDKLLVSESWDRKAHDTPTS